jgi:LysR family transcriptional regulator, putative pyruvate carboxylase regulator
MAFEDVNKGANKGTSPPRFAYKGDRMKPLRAFCQVARLGSVSRAAGALYLSQPAITLQLQALERELGVKLFERVGRRLTPTREGEALYELARPLVEGIDGLPAAFKEQIKGLDAGELHVAAGSSTILYLLPKIVEAYRQKHPEVRLILHNVTGAGGLDLLRSDDVDLAVGSMLDVPGDLDYAPVYRFEPMLITPPDHPLAGKAELKLEDLSPYGLILPPQRLTTYRLVDLVFQQNRSPTPSHWKSAAGKSSSSTWRWAWASVSSPPSASPTPTAPASPRDRWQSIFRRGVMAWW